MKNKNKKILGRILATALMGVVVFLLNVGVVGALTDAENKCIRDTLNNEKGTACSSEFSTAQSCASSLFSNSLLNTCYSYNLDLNTHGVALKSASNPSCTNTLFEQARSGVESCYKTYDKACQETIKAKCTGSTITVPTGSQGEKVDTECYQKEIKDVDCKKDTKAAEAEATKKEEVKKCEETKIADEKKCNEGIEFLKSECLKYAKSDYDFCKNTAETKYNETITKSKTTDDEIIKKCETEIVAKAREKCVTFDFSAEIATATSGLVGEELKCKQNFYNQNIGSCQMNETFEGTKINTLEQAEACFKSLKEKVNEQCKTVCGNSIVEGSEECDDGEGLKSENEDKSDGCFRCKKEDVFRVSEVLKIDEGQSYLERAESGAQSTSLRKGLFFLIIEAIELATKIIGALALLMVIIGGIILMVSSGNSQLQQKGKRTILYAILGLVIAFLSLIIVTFIQSLFYTT
ncbi:DUF4215 domain-containing protein [Patescibacteria group bacterium]